MKRFYCDEEMTKEHQAGEWELEEDHGWWKSYIKKCRGCKKILAERVIK
jgi:hypothetical protein